jgi:PAS domain S-box-containing protein
VHEAERHLPPVLPAAPRREPDPEREAQVGRLVSHLAHEFKTPLAILLGLSARLLSGGLPSEQEDDVRQLRGAAYSLLERVEEVLHVAQLDSGHISLDTRRVDVARLARDTLGSFESVAAVQGQHLAFVAPPELWLQVDEDKLGTILSNLIVNALKFAPAGGVVRCSIEWSPDRLQLEVADSGPGVPPELRQAIFDPFRQAGRARPDAPVGSGLGLAIVRDLALLHGGSVAVADAPEGGALFRVELSARQAEPGQYGEELELLHVAERRRPAVELLLAEAQARVRQRSAPAPASHRTDALVITHDPQLGALVADLLEPEFHVRHAGGLVAGIRALIECPDAVAVLDAGGGADAVRALRRRAAHTPILALAADSHDLARLLDAGADGGVVKPFDPVELRARLAMLARTGQARRDAAGIERGFEISRPAMAVVDADGRLLRANQALRELLERSAHELEGLFVGDLLPVGERQDEARRRELVLNGQLLVDRADRTLALPGGRRVRVALTVSPAGVDAYQPQCLVWLVVPQGRRRRTET